MQTATRTFDSLGPGEANLKVLILCDQRNGHGGLREIFGEQGAEIHDHVRPNTDVGAMISDHRPHVLMVRLREPSTESFRPLVPYIEKREFVSVLLVDEPDFEVLGLAVNSGVTTCLVGPFDENVIADLVGVALARSEAA